MPAPFARTLRSLEADGARPRSVELLLALLVLAWVAWFIFGRVAVCETSASARLEVASAAHAISTLVAGQVEETHLTLGRQVAADEVLVVLDAEVERRALDEKRARADALEQRLKALRGEIEAEQMAMTVQQKARSVALDESRAQVIAAEARLKFAERQAEVSTRLRTRNAISEEELRRDRANVEAITAEVGSLRLGTTRLEQDRTVQESERKARLAKLEREATELRGDKAVEESVIRRLAQDLELRRIRAPVAGTVGEVGEFRKGSVVKAAEKLGTVVPPGEARVVALFPAAAVGRLRVGQPARLRLEGFPWTQYGTLPATVANVGNEAIGGQVRVELTLARDLSTSIPLEHGLTGTAEVEVERLSPVVLLLRAAGQGLMARP